MIIDVKDLAIGYNKELIKNINFKLNKNDFLVVIGENGVGKTTLIKTLIGLVKPIEGNIEYYLDKKELGYLPQNTVRKNVFPATVKEVIVSGNIKDVSNFKNLLKGLNISHLKDKNISELSGGELQKVHLARALIGKPKLLILDEPSSSLSEKSRTNFYDLLYKINNEFNTAIIMISHDLSSVIDIASHILLLSDESSFNRVEDFLTNNKCECENE